MLGAVHINQNNLEIERRFIVESREDKPWHTCDSFSHIEQFYLDQENLILADDSLHYENQLLVQVTKDQTFVLKSQTEWTVRIRYQDSSTYLTLKGVRQHASAVELEWEIERSAAEAIVAKENFPALAKTRYYWRGDDGMLWEVDEFEGKLAGLIIAEVELDSEQQLVDIPYWADKEITGDHSWANSNLADSTL